MAFSLSFYLFTGMSYTMIGHDGCTQSLGVIPCAISWLFKLINRKKDKTWANISVSVSAVEVCGENNAIRDLLSDVDTSNCKETYKPDAFLKEDSVCGIQAIHFILPSIYFCSTFHNAYCSKASLQNIVPDNLRAQLHGKIPYNVSWMMEKPQESAHM